MRDGQIGAGRDVTLEVTTRNVPSVDAYVDGRPQESRPTPSTLAQGDAAGEPSVAPDRPCRTIANMILRAAAVWLLLLVIAVAAGSARVGLLELLVGERTAHQLGTLAVALHERGSTQKGSPS